VTDFRGSEGSTSDHPIFRPLPADLETFLQIIVEPWRQTRRWPVLDYVNRTLRARTDADPEEAAARLPVIQGSSPQIRYQLLFFEHSPSVDPSQKVGLTIGGLFRVNESRDARALVNVIGFLADEDAALAPDPDRPVSLDIAVIDLLSVHLRRELRGWGPEALAEALLHEPALWGTVQTGPEARVRPQAGRLSAYRGVREPDDYLRRVMASLGSRSESAQPPAVSALSLPEALGYLDAVWRNVAGSPLLGRTSPSASARLALPAASPDEFDTRLSALADVIGHFDVELPADADVQANAARERSLARMSRRLALTLEGSSLQRAEAALATLRQIVRIRVGAQHSLIADAPQAFRALGLAYPPIDYGAAWVAVRARATEALNAIREELQAYG
jgi:hypothetical protein